MSLRGKARRSAVRLHACADRRCASVGRGARAAAQGDDPCGRRRSGRDQCDCCCPVCRSRSWRRKNAYTDVDGRYVLQVPPGKHTLRSSSRVTRKSDHRRGRRPHADGRRRADDGEVRRDRHGYRAGGRRCRPRRPSAARRTQAASVITDNVGSQEMKQTATATPPRRWRG